MAIRNNDFPPIFSILLTKLKFLSYIMRSQRSAETIYTKS